MSLLLREMSVMWAAGLFEGEGSIGSHGPIGKYGRRSGRMVLGMNDEDTVRKFAAIMGCGKIHKRRTGSAVWMWQASSKRDFIKAVGLLYPWLTSRRRQRIREVLTCLLLPCEPHYNRWEARHVD